MKISSFLKPVDLTTSMALTTLAYLLEIYYLSETYYLLEIYRLLKICRLLEIYHLYRLPNQHVATIRLRVDRILTRTLTKAILLKA
jgi:hypothetical protein